MGRNDNVSLLLKYYDPPEMCDVTWPCPDPRRLCRKYDGLPGRKTSTFYNFTKNDLIEHFLQSTLNALWAILIHCLAMVSSAASGTSVPTTLANTLSVTVACWRAPILWSAVRMVTMRCATVGGHIASRLLTTVSIVCQSHWSLQHTSRFTFLKAHCPKSPDFQRREGQDHGYSSEGKLSYTKALETCQAKGAMLPSFDKGNDVAEDIADFLPYTYLVTGKLFIKYYGNVLKHAPLKSNLWRNVSLINHICLKILFARPETTCWCTLCWSRLRWEARVGTL